MANPNYIAVEGTVQNLSSMRDSCCEQQLTLSTGNGIVNFILSGDTYIADNQRLRRGMRVVAFYNADLPVPLIFPPRYQAVVVAPVTRNEMVAFSLFDSNLLAQDNSLQLNPGPATVITTTNGQTFSCSVRNRLLLVFYTNTTRSIPPQTTPRRIVVFC